MRFRRILKKTGALVVVVFVMMNVVVAFHAYKFTHFSKNDEVRMKDPEELSILEKMSALFFGIDHPHPKNDRFPDAEYETIQIGKNECWFMPADSAKGTILLFHGYSGNKSQLLPQAEAFVEMGLNAVLVDFEGSGGSEGNQTTIGYFEADQVRDCFKYFRDEKDDKPVYLYGGSMGAAAILRAVAVYQIKPDAIIAEYPFGTMLETVKARFRIMGVPSFPMAHLLVFWGGTLNGFWAFDHNPTDYAKEIAVSTLLTYGEQDPKVSFKEMESIYEHLNGPKVLKTYEGVGHECYIGTDKEVWVESISGFIK